MTTDKTAAGFPILRQSPTAARGPMVAGSFVLCDISSDNPDDPFAVWWMDEDGVTFQGGYYSTRADADEMFDARVEHESIVTGGQPKA